MAICRVRSGRRCSPTASPLCTRWSIPRRRRRPSRRRPRRRRARALWASSTFAHWTHRSGATRTLRGGRVRRNVRDITCTIIIRKPDRCRRRFAYTTQQQANAVQTIIIYLWTNACLRRHPRPRCRWRRHRRLRRPARHPSPALRPNRLCLRCLVGRRRTHRLPIRQKRPPIVRRAFRRRHLRLAPLQTPRQLRHQCLLQGRRQCLLQRRQ